MGSEMCIRDRYSVGTRAPDFPSNPKAHRASILTIPHHSPPLLTTPHHSTPLLATPHHSSPLFAIPHHSHLNRSKMVAVPHGAQMGSIGPNWGHLWDPFSTSLQSRGGPQNCGEVPKGCQRMPKCDQLEPTGSLTVPKWAPLV